MSLCRCPTVRCYLQAREARIEEKMPAQKPQDPTGTYPRERRWRRFDLQFPVYVTFPSAGTVRELDTISRNVSIGGLLLKADDSLPPATQVSLTIEVKGPQFRH